MRNAARLEILAKALKIQWQIEFNPRLVRLIVPIGNVVAIKSG